MPYPVASDHADSDWPMVTTDQQGFIIGINPVFTATFGWTWEEVLGKQITLIIPSAYHDAHHLGFSRFLTTGESRILDHPLQLLVISKQGQEIDSEHLIRAVQHQGNWHFIATLRPLRDLNAAPPSDQFLSNPDTDLRRDR